MEHRLLKLAAMLVVVSGALLQMGCRHGQKQVEDAQPEPLMEVTDTFTSSSEENGTTSTQSSDVTSGTAIVMTDTAKTTNLRVWARKQKRIYDVALLYGQWVSGTSHMLLDTGGRGRSWDTADDIKDEEAKEFSWSLDSNLLSFVYELSLGGVVPKMYLVTFVDNEDLVYRDDYGMSYMWERQSGDGVSR